MAVAQVVDINKTKVGEVDLNDAVFGLEVKPAILHEIVRMQRAAKRGGNACTKTTGGSERQRQEAMASERNRSSPFRQSALPAVARRRHRLRP